MNRKTWLLALAMLLFGGCASQPKWAPIIGIFGVPPERLAEIRAAGFTHLAYTPSQEYLDAALSNQLEVIAYASGFSSKAVPANVRRFSRHEALWGWYLFDEPDLHRVPPGRIERKYNLLKRHTSKPAMLMLSSGVAAEHYADIPDVLAFDWYPVAWAPVATLNRELRFARIAAAGKPFYATLQAFSWEAFPHLVRTDAPSRNPTEAELRCMVYLSFLHGAGGLLFYTYSASTWKLREHPELWAALTNVVADVKRDLPIFEKRIVWWPADLEYEGGASRMFNEIYDARIAAGMFELERNDAGRAPGFYFMLVNTSAEPCAFRFKFPIETDYLVSTADGAEVLFVDNGWMREEFEPFQVKIYGPVRPTKRPDWLAR